MDTDLARIKVALAVMSNAELDALSKATYKVDQIAPGLLAWLDSACVWQLQRRNGYHYDLQPPEAAIPSEEDAVPALKPRSPCATPSRGSHRPCVRYSMRCSIY